MLPLHLACVNKAPVEVVRALLEAYPEGEAAWLGRDVKGCGLGMFACLFAQGCVTFSVVC